VNAILMELLAKDLLLGIQEQQLLLRAQEIIVVNI
jgi:hypothetical protein